MKKYGKYKPSRISYLGKIPAHWGIKKLKYISQAVLGKMLTNNNQGNYHLKKYLRAANLQWLVVSVSDIKSMWFSEPELKKLRVRENDLLVSEGGEVGRTCIWKNELDECYIQNSVHKITFHKEYQPRFFLYQFYFLGSIGYFESIVNRISIGHLTGEKIKEIFAWLPPLPEQTAIATYLDGKTAYIDGFISAKKQTIELLKEERAVIINNAVTEGINPDVKLKPSGIDWLGDIPSHWSVRKLKYIAKVNSDSLSEKEDSDLRIEYIDISSVNSDGDIISTSSYFYSASPSRARRIVKKGDTILSTVRTYLKAIAFIDVSSDYLICSTGFAVISPSVELLPKFLFYICRSEKIIETIMALSKGVSYPAIDSVDVKNIAVWVPPTIDEQDRIVKYIEFESKKVAAAISKIEKEIELIQEYRAALISEVVTGKIKVI